jgi:tetrahydromethanopterin S-methyltransferase subunit B
MKHFRNFVPKNQLLDSVTKIVLLESTETVIVYLVEPNDCKLEELDEILDYILHLLILLLPQLT